MNHALSSAMLFCRKILHSKTVSFDFRRSFGTPQAPSAFRRFLNSAGEHVTASEAFGMSLRAFLASCAHVRRRNCAILRSKFARFCMQNFENQKKCGHRRTHEAHKRHPRSLHTRCKRHAACPERSDALCREILRSKTVMFR